MNVYVCRSSWSIADASVTTGRMITSRGSRMRHLLRPLECGCLDDQRVRPEQVVRRLLTERPHLHARNVARRAMHDRLVAIREHEHVQPRVAWHADRREQTRDHLRLRRLELKTIDHEHAALLRTYVVRG